MGNNPSKANNPIVETIYEPPTRSEMEASITILEPKHGSFIDPANFTVKVHKTQDIYGIFINDIEILKRRTRRHIDTRKGLSVINYDGDQISPHDNGVYEIKVALFSGKFTSNLLDIDSVRVIVPLLKILTPGSGDYISPERFTIKLIRNLQHTKVYINHYLIPRTDYTSGVEYYISATDSDGNLIIPVNGLYEIRIESRNENGSIVLIMFQLNQSQIT